MTPWWQGFITGVMTAVLPSLLALAWFAWRAPTVEDPE
jgi:hypothetical protein